MLEHVDMEDEYYSYSDLSLNAQIIFVNIEHILWRNMTNELKITKEDLAWECNMSIPGIKVALRELKKSGYIESKNNNSPIIKVGEWYKYKSKEGEW